jgi:hypothetical protein
MIIDGKYKKIDRIKSNIKYVKNLNYPFAKMDKIDIYNDGSYTIHMDDKYNNQSLDIDISSIYEFIISIYNIKGNNKFLYIGSSSLVINDKGKLFILNRILDVNKSYIVSKNDMLDSIIMDLYYMLRDYNDFVYYVFDQYIDQYIDIEDLIEIIKIEYSRSNIIFFFFIFR